MLSTHSTTSEHGSKRSRIVQELLAQIVQGKIAAGTRLVTQNLEKEFQTSATPIREALAELAGIGIIELLPNRGATVREVTRRDIKEISQVRRALECEAVRLAVGKIDPPNTNQANASLNKLKESIANCTTLSL
jgi:DNA-binding GntR family transcriptional regulator